MKNKDFKKTALITTALLVIVMPAAAITIQSPDTDYTNNESLEISVKNETGYDDYNFTLETEEGILEEDNFSESSNGYLEENVLIESVSNGVQVNLIVRANKSGGVKTEKTNFTVDRGLEYSVEKPVNNLNTSETFQINITDKDRSGINLSYGITDVIEKKNADLTEEVNLTAQEADMGDYILNLNISDEAGNRNQESIEVTYDNVSPSYSGTVPGFFNETLSLQKSFSSGVSGLKNLGYSIKESDGSTIDGLQNLEFGEKYGSLDDSLIHDTSYNIEIQSEDYAGNSYSKTFSAEADFEAPPVTLTSPENLTKKVSENQLFKVAFSPDGEEDQESGVSQETFIETPNSKISVGSEAQLLNTFDGAEDNTDPVFNTDGLDARYDTTALDDGVYDFVLGVVDNAGNVNRKEFKLAVSNSPPNITSVEYEGEELINGSTVGDGSISVDVESEGVGLSSLIYSWDSQEVKDVEDRVFEVNVSDGTHVLEIEAVDGVGNTYTESFSDILVETGAPGVELTRETSEGWSSSHNVSVSCSDDASGVDGSAVFLNSDEVKDWKDGGENWFDISEHGQNEFEFRCRDNAGNVGTESLVLKVDSENPGVAEFTPGNDAEGIGTDTTFEAELFNNSILSGLDISSSDIDVSEGQAGGLDGENGVLSAELSDMPFETDISVNGTLVDDVGNEAEFETSFETEQEPAEWITIADSIQASEEMALGVMRRDVGEDVGDISISIEDSDSIREFDLRRSEGGRASVMVVEDDDVPEGFAAPEGSVYRYAGVETEGIEAEQILSSNITFEVNSSWAESNGGQESLSIIRNQGDGWKKLNGTSVENGDESVFISAKVSEFSWFAVKSDNPSSGGLIPSISLPSFSLAFGLADLMTAGLLGAIFILVLYLLELLGLIKLPHSIVEKVERVT